MRREGQTLVPLREQDAKLLGKLPENRPLNVKANKPRSGKAHRLYFAVLDAICEHDHWPEGHEPFQDRTPDNPITQVDADLLRAWLQTKAGYRECITFPLEAAEAAARLIHKIRAEDKFCFMDAREIKGDIKLCVFIPDSIAYEELDEQSFAPIRTAVFDLIEQIVGVPADKIIFEAPPKSMLEGSPH